MRRHLGLAVILLCPAPAVAPAQQWGTDDMGIVNAGSCQLEMWHGQRASWVIPACAPFPKLELGAGAGWTWSDDGPHELQYALQVKSALPAPAPGGLGIAVAAGAGLSRERRFGSAFVYVPVGTTGWDERVTAYGNLGWRYSAGGDGHDLTYGIRSDLEVSPRLSLIAELFGAQGDGLPAEVQAGVRVTILPDRAQGDVSYGRFVQKGADSPAAGWTVGLSLTPPP